MNLVNRLIDISKIAFDFDFNKYLEDNVKSILVFKIHKARKKYSLLFGDDIDNILECANSNYVDAQAGYKVNVNDYFRKQSKCDVFLISDEVLKSTPLHIDAIITHELAHMLIDSNNQPVVSQEVKEMAKKLYNATDIENEKITRHNEEFCQLVVYGCINYQLKTEYFKDIQNAVESSMLYDTFKEYNLQDFDSN